MFGAEVQIVCCALKWVLLVFLGANLVVQYHQEEPLVNYI